MKIAIFKLKNDVVVAIPYPIYQITKESILQIENQFEQKVIKNWVYRKELMENQALDIIKTLDISKSFENIKKEIVNLGKNIKTEPVSIFSIGDKIISSKFGDGIIKDISFQLLSVQFGEKRKLYSSDGKSLTPEKLDILRIKK